MHLARDPRGVDQRAVGTGRHRDVLRVRHVEHADGVGPLTNIALLLAIHPELSDRIERIVLMGGAIDLGNVTPSAEFNVWCDPEAAHRVFTSGLNVTMVGLDVTHRAMLSAARAEALRETGRAGAVVADLHAFYRRFHAEVYGHDDTPVHDALAVATVIQPDLVTTEYLPTRSRHHLGPGRGRTVVDQPAPARPRAERPGRDGRRGRAASWICWPEQEGLLS